MLGTLLGKLIEPVFGVIDKAVKDKDLRATLKHDLSKTILEDGAKQLQTSADIIIAEAKGGSWLQRSWRPITMLVFVGIVVAHYLGFTPDNITQAETLELFALIKIGLGGYVVGRSAEKIAGQLTKKGML